MLFDKQELKRRTEEKKAEYEKDQDGCNREAAKPIIKRIPAMVEGAVQRGESSVDVYNFSGPVPTGVAKIVYKWCLTESGLTVRIHHQRECRCWPRYSDVCLRLVIVLSWE